MMTLGMARMGERFSRAQASPKTYCGRLSQWRGASSPYSTSAEDVATGASMSPRQ